MPEKAAENGSVVVFFGFVASGKSFLARSWADRKKCPYFNTDVVRKQLLGMAPETSGQAAAAQGIYRPEHTRRTYDELASRARDKLVGGKVFLVVLDGSYLAAQERSNLVRTLPGGCRVSFVYCYCSERVTRQRLALRAADRKAVSDGSWEIYQLQKKNHVIPPQLKEGRMLKLDTDKPITQLLKSVDDYVNGGN